MYFALCQVILNCSIQVKVLRNSMVLAVRNFSLSQFSSTSVRGTVVLTRGEKACSQAAVTRTTPPPPSTPRKFGAGLRTKLCPLILRSPPSASRSAGGFRRAPSSWGRGLPLPLPPPRLRAAAGRGHVSAARRGRGPDFRAAEGDAAA